MKGVAVSATLRDQTALPCGLLPVDIAAFVRLGFLFMKEPSRRRASRLILLDSTRRALLFRHTRTNGETFWAPPGGGVEGAETFVQAPLREASEELGITPSALRLLWENVVDFEHIGGFVRQEEQFFLIDEELQVSQPDVRKVHKKEGIVEIRWWSPADLESTNEPIFPEDLSSQLRKIFQSSCA